jgi:ADP-ribose pyrophosphatase
MKLAFVGDNFSVGVLSRQVRSVWQAFEVVLRPEIALCVPITAQGQIVLLRQYRVAVDEVLLEFPAGRLGDGEDAECAIRRELLEETGFRVSMIHRIGAFLTAPHFSNERVNVFVASGELSSLPTPTPKEDLFEIVELPPSTINGLIIEGRMLDSKSITAHALVRAQGTQFGVTL